MEFVRRHNFDAVRLLQQPANMGKVMPPPTGRKYCTARSRLKYNIPAAHGIL